MSYCISLSEDCTKSYKFGSFSCQQFVLFLTLESVDFLFVSFNGEECLMKYFHLNILATQVTAPPRSLNIKICQNDKKTRKSAGWSWWRLNVKKKNSELVATEPSWQGIMASILPGSNPIFTKHSPQTAFTLGIYLYKPSIYKTFFSW